MRIIGAIENFLKIHTITDYYTGGNKQDYQSINFKIDNASYTLSPFYEGSGIVANFPAGFHLLVKPVGADEYSEICCFHTYINDYIIDTYSKIYSQYSETKKENPNHAHPYEIFPYLVWKMITHLLSPRIPFYRFMDGIHMYSEGIGGIVTVKKSDEDIRAYIHNKTECLKSDYPWTSLYGNEQKLFEYVIEHLIRCSHKEHTLKYTKGMSSLIDFIQSNSVGQLREMIDSCPNIKNDIIYTPNKNFTLSSPFFDRTVFNLKRETATWVNPEYTEKLGINIDNGVRIARDYEMLCHIKDCGLSLGWHVPYDMGNGLNRGFNTMHIEKDVGYNGMTGVKPTKDEIIATINGHPVLEDATEHFKISVNQTFRYSKRYQANIIYRRYEGIGKDDIMRDRISLKLMPSYQYLDDERVCWITEELLRNGFNIKTCNRDMSPQTPYDSGWQFFGINQDDAYINNPKNIRQISLDGLLKLCPHITHMMQEFEENNKN